MGSLEDLKHIVQERNQWAVRRQSNGTFVQLMRGAIWFTIGHIQKTQGANFLMELKGY